MSACRYDAEKGYRSGDGPCEVDEYGDPTHHCTARRNCAEHVGANELTCARCLGRTRVTVRRIPSLAALMVPVAVTSGVNSEAANLAGPAADYSVFSARRAIDRRWIVDHIPEAKMKRAMTNLLLDDDEQHPLSVLGRWAMMIAEDYGHELPVLDVISASDYLDRQLGRIAQDPEQDFPLLTREVRKCRRHLEAVLSTAIVKERGAPCPECTDPEVGVGPRLVREHGHWCDDEACERIHYDTDEADRWACPRERDHVWTHEAYERYIEERRLGA